MAKLLSVCLLFLLWGVRQSLAQEDLPPLNTEHDVVAFSNAVIQNLERRIETSNMSPSAFPAAQENVRATERRLRQCEDELATNHLVWQYKMCATQAQRMGMDAIRMLLGGGAMHAATSSASRLKIFPFASLVDIFFRI